MRIMAKRLVIVLIAIFCFFGVLGCNDVQPGLNDVLAIGMNKIPNTTKYIVGQHVDVTGGKVVVIYAKDPEVEVLMDLTEEMLDKNSYDINTTGIKLVVVNYAYKGKTYSTGFTVEYEEKPFRVEAIEEVNKYKASVVYSTNGKLMVDGYKSLATVNIKLASDEAEAKSIVENFKAKVDAVLTKAQEEELSSPSAAITKAQANANKQIKDYKASEVSSFKENYKKMVEAIKSIASAEISLARTEADINVAVAKAKANIDNAALGNKTLDEINSAKIAADTAKKAAELAKDEANNAKKEASTKADEAKAKAQEALAAKTSAQKAQKAAEVAKAKAEEAQKAAQKAKENAEAIQKDVNASKKQINDALIAAQKAQAQAKLAEENAIVAKNEAQAQANASVAAKLAAEAAQAASEAAKLASETALAGAKAAQAAAEAAAEEAKDYLTRIEEIYNALPVAEDYINEVKNYVNDDDYTGINKLLVVSLKDSYSAAIKASRSEAEIIEIVAKAKAALDLAQTISQETAGAALDLEAAKASAKAEFKAYVNMLEYEAPATIDLSKYANPDQQKLIDKINELKANVEAEIDAATTIQEVNNALAKGQGKVYLETIYVDYYSSCIVTELVSIFRNDYEPHKIIYSAENYEKLLDIVKRYETYIGRIDKLDEINEKFEEAKKEMEEVPTISGEIANLIANISYPIRLNISVDDENLACYYPATAEELFDSKVKELDPIQVLLDVVYALTDPAVQTRVLHDLENYVDETGATRNLLDEYAAACDRYTKLVDANTNATTGASIVIDAINAIPFPIKLSTIGTVVNDARAVWNAWVSTYFTSLGYNVLDAEGNVDVALVETLNLKMVTNYATLVKAEARLEELKAAKVEASTPVTGIIDKIEAIDDAEGYITLACESLIQEVDEMIAEWIANYNIDDINMDIISNKATLEAFRARLEVLKQAKEAAETETTGVIAVIDAIINAIPEDPYITLAHKSLIEQARADYDDWKAAYAIDETAEPINADLVTNRNTLFKYEERISQLEAAKAAAEDATTGEIALINAIPAYDPATPATNELTLSNESQVNDVRNEYNAWINEYFTSKGYVAEDEPTNTALVTNYAKLEQAEARLVELNNAKQAAEEPTTGVIALIDAIDDVNSYIILASEDAIIAAEEAYSTWEETYHIDPVNTYLVSNKADMEAARARLEVLKQAKEAVEAETTGTIALIDAIDDVNEYIILASKTAIDTADTAYEAWKTTYVINETVEPINADITYNRADLQTAKARLAELENAKVAAEEPTTGVIALIDAIPQPVTLDDIAQVDATVVAYENWKNTYNIDETAEPINANIVDNRQVLADAVTRYEEVLLPLLNDTKEAIENIGNISINSGDAIAAAEELYFQLKEQNKRAAGSTLPEVDLNAWLNNGLTKLQNARREYEIALYVDKVEKATHIVEEKYIELTALMGDFRSGEDKKALFDVTKSAKVNFASVTEPTPDPVLNEDGLGNWPRTAYENECTSVKEVALDDLYKSAKYLVTGDSETGFVVTIYAAGTYTSFISKNGDNLTSVKDLVIDELVGEGHVEFSAITVTGDVIVNGGGSSSVVFNGSNLHNVIINKEGVRVAFNSTTSVDNMFAGNESINSVIIELDGQNPIIEANSSIEFRGTKGDGLLEIKVKKDNIELSINYKDVKVELEEVSKVTVNNVDYDTNIHITDAGETKVEPKDIEIDDAKLCGDVTYVIEGTKLVYGGEGQKLPYNDGFKLGAKIVAPKNVTDFSKVVVTANDVEYTPVIVDGAFTYVFSVNAVPAKQVLKVQWTETSDVFEYVIEVLEGTTFALSAGTLSEDANKVAGPKAVASVEENIITFTGELKYYSENELAEGKAAGYYVAVTVTPDKEVSGEAVTKVYEVNEEVLTNGITFALTWINVEFKYHVEFDAELTLEFPTDVAKIETEFETVAATVNGKELSVSGTIPYFTEVLEIGRSEGHRVGFSFAPKFLGLDLTEATITTPDGRTGKFYDEFVTTGNVLNFYPLIQKGTETYTFSIKWNKYTAEQVYTITIAEGTTYQVPAATSVEIVDPKTSVKVFEEVDFSAKVLSKFANQEVEWQVSDESVATISAEGRLKALKAGKVIVKVICKATPEIIDEVEVTVSNYTVAEALKAKLGQKVVIEAKTFVLQNKGYWFGDETGLLLAHNPSETPSMGAHVLITGVVATFKESERYTRQLTSTSFTVLEGDAPHVNTNSVEFDLADAVSQKIDTLAKAEASGLYGKIIKVKGLVKGSGYNWYVYDAEGNKFYINNTADEYLKGLKADTTMVLELLVREVYYKDDTTTFKNFKASEIGGCVVSAPKALAEGNKTILVDQAAGEEKLVDGLYYVKGINLFNTLEAALEKAENGYTIVLAAGTYKETSTSFKVNGTNLSGLVIDKEVTIKGANAGVKGQADARKEESIIANSLRVSANNVKFDGIRFGNLIDAEKKTYGSVVIAPDAVENLTIENCIISSSFDGFLRPVDTSAVQTNVKFNKNLVTEYAGGRVIYLYKVDGLTINENKFDSAVIFDPIRVQTYLTGKVEINNNVCYATKQSFIMIMGVKAIDATIAYNYVEGVAGTIVDFRNMNDAKAEAIFNIKFNTFKDCSKNEDWGPIRIRTAGYTADNKITINVNYNKFIDTYSVLAGARRFVTNPSAGTAYAGVKIYNMDNNYFEMDGSVVTVLNDELFHGVAISYNNPYATADEVPTKDPDAPTAEEVTLDFVTNFNTYAKSWTNGYVKKTVSEKDLGLEGTISVELSSVSKQTGTITDRPVIASKSSAEQYVTVSGFEGKLTKVTFTLAQWSPSKKFNKVVLQSSEDGKTWTNASDDLAAKGAVAIAKDQELTTTTDLSKAKYVRLVVLGSTAKNTQVGLTSIKLTIE